MLNQPWSHTLLAVLSVALATFLTRAAPFALFGGGRAAPGWILYLGRMLPPAIMALLVVYCLRNTSLLAYPFGLPELLASAAAVGLQLWRRNNLLSVIGATVFYMVLAQAVF